MPSAFPLRVRRRRIACGVGRQDEHTGPVSPYVKRHRRHPLAHGRGDRRTRRTRDGGALARRHLHGAAKRRAAAHRPADPHESRTVAVPVDGGTLSAGQHITLKPQQWATSYVIEVSSKEGTWGRTRFIETLKNGQYETTLPAEEIKVDGKLMADGTTYYARCKTSYLDFDGNNHTTAYGPTISFVYRESAMPATGDVNGDGEVNIADVNAVIDMILGNVITPAGDVNGDGEINIADVNAVIDIILNG